MTYHEQVETIPTPAGEGASSGVARGAPFGADEREVELALGVLRKQGVGEGAMKHLTDLLGQHTRPPTAPQSETVGARGSRAGTDVPLPLSFGARESPWTREANRNSGPAEPRPRAMGERGAGDWNRRVREVPGEKPPSLGTDLAEAQLQSEIDDYAESPAAVPYGESAAAGRRTRLPQWNREWEGEENDPSHSIGGSFHGHLYGAAKYFAQASTMRDERYGANFPPGDPVEHEGQQGRVGVHHRGGEGLSGGDPARSALFARGRGSQPGSPQGTASSNGVALPLAGINPNRFSLRKPEVPGISLPDWSAVLPLGEEHAAMPPRQFGGQQGKWRDFIPDEDRIPMDRRREWTKFIGEEKATMSSPRCVCFASGWPRWPGFLDTRKLGE